ncbi:hypothetical protein KY285_035942 [Solanum tuberosum]|nr:hypothetical protein KY285_035942 [Solanum tuberosum]
MAREPPAELPRPPDKDQPERHGKSNKSHQTKPHNSSHSSSNSQNTEAINTVILEKELEGTHKIISHPTDSTVPIERSRDAILKGIANKFLEVRPQIRSSSGQVLADSATGDYSPQLEVHLTEISIELDGGIIGGEDFGKTRGQLTGVHGISIRGTNSPPLDIHLSEISNNINGGIIRSTNSRQSTDVSADDPMTLNRRKIQDIQHIEEEVATMETHNLSKQQDTNQSKEAQSSNFSFGIAGNSRNLTSPLSSDAMQGISDQNRITEKNKDNQQQRNGQPAQGQQNQGKAMQSVHIHNETNGQTSRKGELSKQVDNKGKDSQNYQSKAITQHVSTNATQNDKERANIHYQQNFPKISNNYARYDPNLQKNKSVASHDNYDNNQEEETPIVHIWVALLELPWHCYNKVLLTTILSSIGKVMYLDSPTSQRTRGSMARVKIQIDLTKPRPPHVWVGFKNSDPNKGRWQKVQYEGIPNYCMYCKHQGHMDNVCTIKRRDEDFKNRREVEAEKQNRPKGDQEKGGTKVIQVQDKDKTETNTKAQDIRRAGKMRPRRALADSEEETKKNQEQTHPKTAWRPVSLPHKRAKDIMKKAPETSGISPTISIHNNYIDSEMQEQQGTGNVEECNNNKVSDQGMQSPQGSDNDSSYLNLNNKEGVSKGGNLTHVLHEVDHTDPRLDYRPPATTTSRHTNQHNQKKHNPMQADDSGQFQGHIEQEKRDAIKRKQQKEVENQEKNRQQSDYDVVNSEDELDEDTQSLNENNDDEEGDETNAHLIKAFGSTFRSEFQEEIQEVADQQGLSPRGRKKFTQLIKSTSISTFAKSSRPNTRSKSKGF